MKPIRRVAVLGAGTMGSRIAAQLANAGVPSLLLDLTPAAAKAGLDAALKSRPAAFMLPDNARLVTTGGFDTDMAGIAACGWVVEAVAENLDIKRLPPSQLLSALYAGAGLPEMIAEHLSTNPSLVMDLLSVPYFDLQRPRDLTQLENAVELLCQEVARES